MYTDDFHEIQLLIPVLSNLFMRKLCCQRYYLINKSTHGIKCRAGEQAKEVSRVQVRDHLLNRELCSSVDVGVIGVVLVPLVPA